MVQFNLEDALGICIARFKNIRRPRPWHTQLQQRKGRAAHSCRSEAAIDFLGAAAAAGGGVSCIEVDNGKHSQDIAQEGEAVGVSGPQGCTHVF